MLKKVKIQKSCENFTKDYFPRLKLLLPWLWLLLIVYIEAVFLQILFHSSKDAFNCHKYLSFWLYQFLLHQTLASFSLLIVYLHFNNTKYFVCWLYVKIKHSFYGIWHNGMISWIICYFSINMLV